MPGSYIQYAGSGAVAPAVKPPTAPLKQIPVNDYLFTTAEHPGMYFLTDAGSNAQQELDVLNKAAAGGWQSPWAANSPFSALTPQWLDRNQKRKAELEGLLNPGAIQSKPNVSVPPVTMPANVNPATSGTVSAPGSNIGVPTWNQAGTKGNLSQDMWDSYTRAATANQGAVMKPPTTGWM